MKFKPITKLLSVAIVAAVVFSCSGCTAGTGVTYTETKETLDDSGVVVAKEVVSVERKSHAMNTKVDLKDLESTLTFSPTNGLASGLSASGIQGAPETQLLRSLETIGYLTRNMQPPAANDQSERLDRLERLIEDRLPAPIPDRSPAPPPGDDPAARQLSDREEALIRYFRELGESP